MNPARSSFLIEIMDRAVALFDDRGYTLAVSDIDRAGAMHGIRSVLKQASEIDLIDTSLFLHCCPEIRLQTNCVSKTVYSLSGQPVGLITSNSFKEQALKLFSLLQIPQEFLYVMPTEGVVDPTASLRNAMNRFLYHGAETVAICIAPLLDQQFQEEELKKKITTLYPPHLLGSIPILIPLHLVQQRSEWDRLESVVVSGYVRGSLLQQLKEVQQLLREHGFTGRLLTNTGDNRLVPSSQCYPWDMLAYDRHRFFTDIRHWSKEEAVSEGVAIHIDLYKIETAIIESGGTYKSCSITDCTPLRTLFPHNQKKEPVHDLLASAGLLPDQEEQGYSEGNGSIRYLSQWIQELASLVRRKAMVEGGQLFSDTPLMVSGTIGGMVACHLADSLGIRNLYLTLGRPFVSNAARNSTSKTIRWSANSGWLSSPSIGGTQVALLEEVNGLHYIEGYETECLVPPGWIFKPISSGRAALIRRSS
ncbi:MULTISPECIES: hypothetical protein [unclassified Paenibacillus]|uniref:hypothetical protein n=1 Tax=unclassified Paenibacillus TaxID=185978 RepID=UPI001AE10F80|nr:MULTISPECIES: hypothetical protein [unclassified Paenibacillus]MBP1155745.1 hypothetical protein [Paenibacillus sp. PvP091]MBP1168869.1 hypothetical protein [Paenibacillus sp. PvR098]MBP2439897.1 hypothetical protein [Paenibacillus sp. PvP052]